MFGKIVKIEKLGKPDDYFFLQNTATPGNKLVKSNRVKY